MGEQPGQPHGGLRASPLLGLGWVRRELAWKGLEAPWKTLKGWGKQDTELGECLGKLELPDSTHHIAMATIGQDLWDWEGVDPRQGCSSGLM